MPSERIFIRVIPGVLKFVFPHSPTKADPPCPSLNGRAPRFCGSRAFSCESNARASLPSCTGFGQVLYSQVNRSPSTAKGLTARYLSPALKIATSPSRMTLLSAHGPKLVLRGIVDISKVILFHACSSRSSAVPRVSTVTRRWVLFCFLPDELECRQQDACSHRDSRRWMAGFSFFPAWRHHSPSPSRAEVLGRRPSRMRYSPCPLHRRASRRVLLRGRLRSVCSRRRNFRAPSHGRRFCT